MASLFTHALVGTALGQAGISDWRKDWRFWCLIIVCSILPDIDSIGFLMGVPYGNLWGHRGMTHSLLFAVLVGLVVVVALRIRGRPVLLDAALATLVVASHGVLDAMTTGGLGVEFFWPVDTRRYFLPWEFIPVTPLGAHMLSARGLSVLLTEAVLFLPAWAYAFWPRALRPSVE